MDPVTLLVAMLPAKDPGWALLVLLALSGLCNCIAPFILPPKPGAPRYALKKAFYVAITWGAANLGKAANRIQCGRTGVMVPYQDREKARALLTGHGIAVLTKKKPDT
ncbi:hypothetical protein [Gluconobacter morbifer]|uniref:Uncharacterized protein n=1 Tax=Gluconobacter morbifer G707 TaxID=1088869 RepID=G6XMR9_9PROT|nr:hypothetical protein [Gluconobacter morbifer]EHH66968.1 hypothetical protein GMO_27870 [Gluconobacter morbifer G707]